MNEWWTNECLKAAKPIIKKYSKRFMSISPASARPSWFTESTENMKKQQEDMLNYVMGEIFIKNKEELEGNPQLFNEPDFFKKKIENHLRAEWRKALRRKKPLGKDVSNQKKDDSNQEDDSSDTIIDSKAQIPGKEKSTDIKHLFEKGFSEEERKIIDKAVNYAYQVYKDREKVRKSRYRHPVGMQLLRLLNKTKLRFNRINKEIHENASRWYELKLGLLDINEEEEKRCLKELAPDRETELLLETYSDLVHRLVDVWLIVGSKPLMAAPELPAMLMQALYKKSVKHKKPKKGAMLLIPLREDFITSLDCVLFLPAMKVEAPGLLHDVFAQFGFFRKGKGNSESVDRSKLAVAFSYLRHYSDLEITPLLKAIPVDDFYSKKFKKYCESLRVTSYRRLKSRTEHQKIYKRMIKSIARACLSPEVSQNLKSP